MAILYGVGFGSVVVERCEAMRLCRTLAQCIIERCVLKMYNIQRVTVLRKEVFAVTTTIYCMTLGGAAVELIRMNRYRSLACLPARSSSHD